MNEILVTITHPCRVRGERVEPGAQVALTPTDAQALLNSGRGRLVDPSDLAPLQTALAETFQLAAQAQLMFGLSPESAASVASEAVHALERASRPRGIGFILPATDK